MARLVPGEAIFYNLDRDVIERDITRDHIFSRSSRKRWL